MFANAVQNLFWHGVSDIVRVELFEVFENAPLRKNEKFDLILPSSRKVQPKRSGVSVVRLRPLQYLECNHEADYCLC